MKSKKGITMAMALCLAMTFLGCGKSPNEAVMATEVMTTEETTEVETAAAEESTEETTAETEAETKVETKNETKAETKAAPKAPAQAAPAPAQAAPAPAPTEPVHEHVWKEHTATRDEWVPNVVTVTETKKVEVGYNIVCNCGEKFFMGEGFDPHNTAHLLAGEPDNYHSEAAYEERTETHEEDQGYYQTIEYVDYYYCECGATK